MPPATSSAGALQNLNTAMGQQQSPDQIYTGESQSLGIPQAQQQVSGLRQAITNTTNLLNQVAPSVYGRTQNSLVTDAQATRQIGNEQAPIQTKLAGLNTSEGSAANDLQSLLGQAGTLSQLKTTGQENNISNLEGIYKDLTAKEQQDAANTLAQQNFQLDQQKLAEQQREANQSAAISSSKASASSAPSAAEIKQADMAGASQYLSSLKGGDGHVSQKTWNNAYQQWTGAGYNSADFIKQFMPYINQRYKGYAGFS